MSAQRLSDDQLSGNALRQRRYRETPEGRLKDQIRSRVAYALKRGRLVKLPCFCGETEVEGHHYVGYDLEHALDVVWMCKKHHERLHPQPRTRRKYAA